MNIMFEEVVAQVEPNTPPEETEEADASEEQSKEAELEQMRGYIHKMKCREARLMAD